MKVLRIVLLAVLGAVTFGTGVSVFALQHQHVTAPNGLIVGRPLAMDTSRSAQHFLLQRYDCVLVDNYICLDRMATNTETP